MMDRGEIGVYLERITADPERAALFFDIDGVLAPIRPRPEQAVVPEATRALLRRLSTSYGMVAVVSGRSLETADSMVGIRSIVVVGDHGQMMRDVDGRVSHVTEVDTRLFRQATAALVIDPEIVAAGVRVEEKPGSVALHTRGLEDPAAATRVALAAAERTARGLGLLVRAGRMVVEIRPPGVDKGTAVDALLDRAAVKAALYVGDDTTDVDAMRALARRRSSGLQVLLVGVRSAEMPDGLAHLADSLIEQDEVELLLRALLDRSP